MRKLAMGGGAVLICLGAATASLCGVAKAGGGFSGGPSSFGNASSDAWTVVVSQSDEADHESHTFANASVSSLYNGHIIEGYANGGNTTNSYIEGDATYDQHNKAKVEVYAKGGSVMGKARSQTFTTIYIDGVTYIVAEELARAMARFTPLGTTAAAASDSNVSAQGSGYIGVNTGTKNEASVRIQN
jgi:hypothetical protein